MKPILSEPQGRLLRALTRLLALPGSDRQHPLVVVESIDSTDWSSLTFAGQRHLVSLVVPGVVVADIPSLDALDLGSTIVADVRVVSACAAAAGVKIIIAVMTIDCGD